MVIFKKKLLTFNKITLSDVQELSQRLIEGHSGEMKLMCVFMCICKSKML